MLLTQFSLIPPEEFSGSSLTQKWNVGVSTLPSTHSSSDAAQNAASKVIHILRNRSVGYLCQPTGYNVPSLRQQGPLCVATLWVTWQLKAPVVTWVLMRAESAGRQMTHHHNHWNTETQTTAHGGNTQGCDKAGTYSVTYMHFFMPLTFC